MRNFFARKLARDERGAFTIEVAIIAPLLATMSLGAFEAGSIVSRQLELQSAVQETETIALAVNSGASIETSELKAILKKSAGVQDNQIVISRFYRCGAATKTVSDPKFCVVAVEFSEEGTGAEVTKDPAVASYLSIQLKDTYTPTWTKFGVGDPVNFDIHRTVMLQ